MLSARASCPPRILPALLLTLLTALVTTVGPALGDDEVEEALVLRGPDGAPVTVPASVYSPLRTTQAQACVDGDTVWIGHVYGNTGLPGDATGYGPFHIGRGYNRSGWAGSPAATINVCTGSLVPTTAQANNGYWDFDRFNPGEVDTLQGWWPLISPYMSVAGSNVSDQQRPFFGFDYGNVGNYIGIDDKKATFGVIGFWHADDGSAPMVTLANTNPVTPGWIPISGTRSAWCGLRGHGDVTVVDPITHNAYDEATIDRTRILAQPGVPVSVHDFPGYGSQWDQMLYRDFTHTPGQPMTISFKYTTNLSDGVDTAPNTRIGWFDKDPLLQVAGNFISSTDAGSSAPIDSFMVYIGVPVNDAACAYTNTLTPSVSFRPVYDPLRRWFSEVLRIDQTYYELLSTWGITPGTQSASYSIPASYLDALGSSTVRVVFRVKTNRGFDDEWGGLSGFSSGGAGAAIVDDISVADGGGAPVVTGFENAGDIDNQASTSAAWHATGKPVGVYFHWHDLATLLYVDPNGPIGSPTRLCNMKGNVVTPGDHDRSERIGGDYGGPDQDRDHWLSSPTINLMSSGVGPGGYNGTGIDQEIAARKDYFLRFDLYQNALDFNTTATSFRVAWQAYPALQPNGAKCWGEVQSSLITTSSNGVLGCYYGDGGMGSGASGTKGGDVVTSNASGVPDSLRVYLEVVTACFRAPVTAVDCAANGSGDGAYFDNVSLGFSDDPTPTTTMFDLFQDAFPTNSSDSFVGSPDFDTLAANVRVGRNIAPWTFTLTRDDVPGDSAVVRAPGPDTRMDMIFRILPGPGNYFGTVPTGSQKIGLLKKRPDAGNVAGNQVVAGDGSFWGSYMADIGPFGGDGSVYATAAKPMGGGYNTGIPADAWDPDCWLSARMDTAEVNLFPCDAVTTQAARLRPGFYRSTYHESEVDANWTASLRNGTTPPLTASANRGAFIAPHYRCILLNTATGSPVDNTNIDCTGGSAYLSDWSTVYLPNIGGAYIDPTVSTVPITSGPQLGLTREGTQIIPDGQLTAGSHVEYFFRESTFGNFSTSAQLVPDTTRVLVQGGEASVDGHRWEEFNVLPDRWKDSNYGGDGMACMLVVDCGDRRGDDPIWTRMANTIGLTSTSKRGAGNGYWVLPYQLIPFGISALGPGQMISRNLGQRGTLWDFYQVRAGESFDASGRLGSRLAYNDIPGKGATCGPTRLMLRNYYRHEVDLAADLRYTTYGPIQDMTSDDIGLRTDFMTVAGGSATPRTLIAIGRNLVAAQTDTHPSYFPDYFGADLRDDDYRALTTPLQSIADLTPTAALDPGSPPPVYGVNAPNAFTNDVFDLNPIISGTTAAAYYENTGSQGPYIAAVYTPAFGTHLANTLVAGWTLGLTSGYPYGGQGSRYTLTPGGLYLFWLNGLTSVIGSVCGQPLSAPVGVGDSPGSPGVEVRNLFELRSENPARAGDISFVFRLADADHVQVCVFDVSGRRVRTLADRRFEAGKEYTLRWDGVDDDGHRVPRGVYFYQLRSPRFVSERKVVLLRD